VTVEAVVDVVADQVTSSSVSAPLSKAVVSDRRLLRSCTMVRCVESAGLVASVAGQSGSRKLGTIAEVGCLRWVSGCSLVCCMYTTECIVEVLEGYSC
jgi:hypothetical protein